LIIHVLYLNEDYDIILQVFRTTNANKKTKNVWITTVKEKHKIIKEKKKKPENAEN
jgi:hypothetical protein